MTEQTMLQFHIGSAAGVDYGVWPGDTPEAAFAAMVADAGGTVGDLEVGTADDWIIVLVDDDKK